MPIIQVNIIEGRTVEQKRTLVEGITDVVVKSLNVQPDTVRIIINDMARQDYAIAGKLMIDK